MRDDLPTISAKDNERASLDAAMAQFLARGGAVETVKGFDPKPVERLDWRTNGNLDLSKDKPSQIDAEADAALAAKIRALALNGAGISAIKMELCVDFRRLRRVALAHGIYIPTRKPAGWQDSARAVRERKYDERRDKLAVAITPLAAQGLSLVAIAEQVGCCKKTVAKIIESYGIRRGTPTEGTTHE